MKSWDLSKLCRIVNQYKVIVHRQYSWYNSAQYCKTYYEDMNSTSIKACWHRNNYQVKSGMMHLGKHKAYLTCSLDTKGCHIFNIGFLSLEKLIWKYLKDSKCMKHKQVTEKLVYNPHMD